MIKISGGKNFNNLKVLSPKEVLQYVQNIDNIFIINGTCSLEIKEQLALLGIKENKIDMKCYHIASIYLMSKRKIIYSYIDKYEKVYLMLEDERSKEIYIAKLNYLLSANNKYLKGLMNDNKQYFDKEFIHLTENEVFVDCGSFDRDTLDIFNELTQSKYKEYIALEADSSTYEKLIQKVKDREYANVITFKYACWHEKVELKFDALQTEGSCVTENGNVIVEADSLDHLLGDRSITFIKIDIEGAEENALRGAEKLIRKYKSILAICIYHKIEDYYKLPLLMKELNKDYKLYIRHYTPFDADTVCYAIPKDRLI